MSSENQKTSVLVVTAGLPRSGKSTALNNIFGTDFKSKLSASSVTQTVEARRVSGHVKELIVVDTPGLAAMDIEKSKVKKELENAIGGLNFVLIYCHSVAPNSSISVADECVVKNLQSVFGKDVWNKCVLLFTFSDIVRLLKCRTVEQREEYKKHLDDHATQFSELLLKTCGPCAPKVKAISIAGSKQKVNKPLDTHEILAVPVGEQLKVGSEEHLLVTGMDLSWRALAGKMVIEKAHHLDKDVLKLFIRDKKSIYTPIAGIIIGVAAGFVAGTTVGLAAGGVGAIPGAAIGAGVGAAAGVVAGSAIGGTSVKVGMLLNEKAKAKKCAEKMNKLKAAKKMDGKYPTPILEGSQHVTNRDRAISVSCKLLSVNSPHRPRGKSEPGKRPSTSAAPTECIELPSVTEDLSCEGVLCQETPFSEPEEILSYSKSEFQETASLQYSNKEPTGTAEDPFDPEEPCDPEDPCDPEEPCDPEDPCDPEEPCDLKDLCDPEDPEP